MDASDYSVRLQRGLQAASRVLALAAALVAVACGPEDGRDELVHVGPLDQVPFAVSDFFTPSGQMGDGAKPDFLTVSSDETCKGRLSNSEGRCYKFFYRPGSILWAGSYWAYPSNNWGSRVGRRFKPWRFESAVIDPLTGIGTLYQRYNQVTFNAAVERDTFQINLSGKDSAGKTYTLRNAVITVDGPTHLDVVGDMYAPLNATGGLAVTDPKDILTVKPGTYTVSLGSGWSLVTPNAMGQLEAVAGATVSATPPGVAASAGNDAATTFTIKPGTDAAASFDFTVGTETVHLTMLNPPIPVNFFAGNIYDQPLINITCPDHDKPCEHQDLVTTAKPAYPITRAWQSLAVVLTMAPPCVDAMGVDPMTGAPKVIKSQFAEKTDEDIGIGVVVCAPGTLRADGSVANCPPGKPGILSADQQTIICCDTPFASGVCAGASKPGSWLQANDIIQTVIGGFGWATNYAEFEAQNVVVPGENPHITAARVPTTVYLDDIVWDFVPTPAAMPAP